MNVVYFNPIDLNPFLGFSDLKQAHENLEESLYFIKLDKVREIAGPQHGGNIKKVFYPILRQKGVVLSKLETAPYIACNPEVMKGHNHKFLKRVIRYDTVMEWTGDSWVWFSLAKVEDLNKYPVLVDSFIHTMLTRLARC